MAGEMLKLWKGHTDAVFRKTLSIMTAMRIPSQRPAVPESAFDEWGSYL
ncbi:MAG TPA: hypothetical protein VMT44_00945 [Methanoregula sp.]|nr:hypothetical protein [Methanoregula sp.]